MKGHAHQAEQREQQQDGADGREARDIGPALAQLREHGCGGTLLAGARQAHHQQRGDDGDVADAVDEEAPAFAGGGDEQAGERRADEARHVDHGGVDGDGVGEVGAVLDHLDHEGLAAGHVEGVDDALHRAEREDLGMVMRWARVSAARASDCTMASVWVQTRSLAAVEAVDQTPAKGARRKVGIWPAKLTVPSSRAELVSR